MKIFGKEFTLRKRMNYVSDLEKSIIKFSKQVADEHLKEIYTHDIYKFHHSQIVKPSHPEYYNPKDEILFERVIQPAVGDVELKVILSYKNQTSGELLKVSIYYSF